MRLARQPPTTQSERIFALEQGREADGKRLAKIETTVEEIHTLLVQAKGVLWLATKISAWIGGIATFLVAVTILWKFFTGH